LCSVDANVYHLWTVYGETTYVDCGLLRSLKNSHHHHPYPMSQIKSTAVHLGRLSQSLASSTLVLSALAGGIMVSGGAAKATVSCGTIAAPVDCTEAPWTASGFTSTGNALGSIDIENSNTFLPIQTGIVDIDFDPITDVTTAGTISYTLTHAGTHPAVTEISLSLSKPSGGSGSVTKSIYDTLGGTLLATLTANTTTTVTTPVFGNTFYIVDDYSGSGIDATQNVFKTPGPLPMLGAGAAFGFSRKLRGRVKASRAAA
jgi:hypothetical protein